MGELVIHAYDSKFQQKQCNLAKDLNSLTRSLLEECHLSLEISSTLVFKIVGIVQFQEATSKVMVIRVDITLFLTFLLMGFHFAFAQTCNMTYPNTLSL